MRAAGPTPDDPLGDAGEKEWARLRAQIELASTFWLGFVFSPSPRSVIVLRERADRLLRTQTQSLLLQRPGTPDELRQMLPYLLESAEPTQSGCVWIEAVRADSPGATEQPWTQAWDDLFLRMNERRDALRARLPGGLVFAAPTGIKPRVREAAPDLWSVRSMVIELEATAGAGGTWLDVSELRERTSERLPAPDPEFALAEAERRGATGAAASQAQALMQAARGFLTEKRIDEAQKAAAGARELLRGEGATYEANALAVLAEAEETGGDPAAAADHIERAIALGQRVNKEQVPIRWLHRAGNLALIRSDLAAARQFFEDAESIARGRVARRGETAETLRALAISIDLLGQTSHESGDISAAANAFDESLALCRRVRQLQHDTPDALLNLSVALNRVGAVTRDSGELAAAVAAYEESLALRRRLRELQGEAPRVLRRLAVSLEGIGSAKRNNGDIAGAEAAYEESLTLLQELRLLYGDTPETLRDLSVILVRMGEIRQAKGQLDAAAGAYEESLALGRQRREVAGDAPLILQDLAGTLGRVGDMRLENGDLSAAIAAYEESLALCRRLVDLRGDVPSVLRSLSASLQRLGDTKSESGDLVAAATAYDESLTIARRQCEVGGETIQALRFLGPMLAKLDLVRKAREPRK